MTDLVHIDTKRPSGSEFAAGALLAIVLLLMFLPQPHASMLSTHSWRVELGAALLLFGAVLSFRKMGIQVDSTLGRKMLFLLMLFSAWGMVSALWAESKASVWHHTLLWCEYILIFSMGLSRSRGRTRLVFVTFSCVAVIIGALSLFDYATLPDFKTLEGTLRIRYSLYGELLITIAPLLWIV